MCINWKKIKNFLEYIFPDIKKGEKRKIDYLINVIFFLLGLAALIILIRSFMVFPYSVFESLSFNLPAGSLQISLATFLISTAVFMFIYVCINFIISLVRPNLEWKKIFIIFSSTIIVFLVGSVFILATFGSQVEWILSDSNHTSVATVKCADELNRFLAGHKFTCTIENPQGFEIKELIGELTFTFNNGTDYRIDNFKYSFVAPNDVFHVGLQYNVITTQNVSMRLSTGFHPRFYTEEEEKQREKDFLTYFLALLFLCLITIPLFINQLSMKKGS